MELLENSEVKYLTNFEVNTIVAEKLASKKKVRSQQTLLYTTSKYLKEKTPCIRQQSSSIASLNRDLSKLKVTKQEIMQIINLSPSSQVELSVILNDMDNRFSSEECDQILNLIAEHIPEAVEASKVINSSGVVNEADEPETS